MVNSLVTLQITKRLRVLAFPTVHRVPSQGYLVYRTRNVLKAQYADLPGAEVGELVRAGVQVRHAVTTPELAYTGWLVIDWLIGWSIDWLVVGTFNLRFCLFVLLFNVLATSKVDWLVGCLEFYILATSEFLFVCCFIS